MAEQYNNKHFFFWLSHGGTTTDIDLRYRTISRFKELYFYITHGRFRWLEGVKFALVLNNENNFTSEELNNFSDKLNKYIRERNELTQEEKEQERYNYLIGDLNDEQLKEIAERPLSEDTLITRMETIRTSNDGYVYLPPLSFSVNKEELPELKKILGLYHYLEKDGKLIFQNKIYDYNSLYEIINRTKKTFTYSDIIEFIINYVLDYNIKNVEHINIDDIKLGISCCRAFMSRYTNLETLGDESDITEVKLDTEGRFPRYTREIHERFKQERQKKQGKNIVEIGPHIYQPEYKEIELYSTSFQPINFLQLDNFELLNISYDIDNLKNKINKIIQDKQFKLINTKNLDLFYLLNYGIFSDFNEVANIIHTIWTPTIYGISIFKFIEYFNTYFNKRRKISYYSVYRFELLQGKILLNNYINAIIDRYSYNHNICIPIKLYQENDELGVILGIFIGKSLLEPKSKIIFSIGQSNKTITDNSIGRILNISNIHNKRYENETLEVFFNTDLYNEYKYIDICFMTFKNKSNKIRNINRDINNRIFNDNEIKEEQTFHETKEEVNSDLINKIYGGVYHNKPENLLWGGNSLKNENLLQGGDLQNDIEISGRIYKKLIETEQVDILPKDDFFRSIPNDELSKFVLLQNINKMLTNKYIKSRPSKIISRIQQPLERRRGGIKYTKKNKTKKTKKSKKSKTRKNKY